MLTRIFLFSCILTPFISAKIVPFKPCGGKTLRVSVEPCDAETCSFQRLGKSNFKITFVSNQNSENATLWFKVAYQGLEVPLFNFDMDACFGKNIRCPIIEGSTLLLEHQLEMEDFFPPTRSAMTIQLDGDQGIVFCVVIPVLITN